LLTPCLDQNTLRMENTLGSNMKRSAGTGEPGCLNKSRVQGKQEVARKPSAQKYVENALKHGASDSKIIPAETIVTAPWVRLKCQYGCGGYGQCLTCPPYSPTPEQTAKVIECYKTAVLIHGDDHTDVTRVAATLEREAFLDGYYKAFAMGSGPCRLCKECNIEDEECLHPYEARPSMESCGIDVFQTARNNGMPIQVVRDATCEQNYFAVVLLE